MDPAAEAPDAATPGRSAKRRRQRTGVLKRPCPSCGDVSLQRVADAPAKPAKAGRERTLHMRCKTPGCGFDGSVPRRARSRAARWWSLRRWRRLQPLLRSLARGAAVMGLLGMVAGVGAAVGAAWSRSNVPSLAEQRAALPPGEYHDGDPLPAQHPLRSSPAPATVGAAGTAPLDLRGACVWGRPGRDPYRGSVAEALSAARLPQAVQAALLAKMAAGQPDDRLTIGNDGIHAAGSAQTYAASGFAMTYGRTLCLETRVNFPAGHSEPAELYETRDARGRVYAVMLPKVCGNVSFIGHAVDGAEALPAQLMLRPAVVDEGDGNPPRQVPEPGTLACLAAAGLAWLIVAAWRRHGRRA